MDMPDINIITEWAAGLTGTVEVGLDFSGTHEGKQLDEFCRCLEDAAPLVTVVRDQAANNREPCIRAGSNITYQAVPSGKELELFLGVLSGGPSPGKGGRLAEGGFAERIKSPVALDVYISAACPFCPTVVAEFLEVAGSLPFICLNVVDGLLFRDKSEQAQVKSVPTVVLDGRFRWTGKVDPSEVLDVAASGKDAELGFETLKSIIGSGNAEEAARMMIERGEIYPAFFDILTDSLWPVRLGAMVVFEYIAASRDDRLIRRVVDGLWERFGSLPDEVKADMIQMLGESGHTLAMERIRSLFAGSCTGIVRDAVKEVLGKE
ncbi:MAG: hypothetical protein B5M56_04530 [Desulfococcus sp. 4484_241]|nr:MAG: hypothetical protein B5M56_04530 [Desulfococcus sp. 4484_241]